MLTAGIEDGKLPPSATSLITGGIKASIFFTIMAAVSSLLVFIIQDITTIVDACASAQGCAAKSAGTLLVEEQSFFDFIVVLLLLKFTVLSMMLNNLRFAIPADHPEPHHMINAA